MLAESQPVRLFRTFPYANITSICDRQYKVDQEYPMSTLRNIIWELILVILPPVEQAVVFVVSNKIVSGVIDIIPLPQIIPFPVSDDVPIGILDVLPVHKGIIVS